jgi:hypothetical protein
MQMPTARRDSTSGTWTGGNSKRVREEDGGRPESAKRVYPS